MVLSREEILTQPSHKRKGLRKKLQRYKRIAAKIRTRDRKKNPGKYASAPKKKKSSKKEKRQLKRQAKKGKKKQRKNI